MEIWEFEFVDSRNCLKWFMLRMIRKHTNKIYIGNNKL